MGQWSDRYRIGITGISPGAGASFLAVCLAGYFAEGGAFPAVAELGYGGLYYGLGMDRRFVLKEFHSFYKAARGNGSLRTLENQDGGINWALRLPTEMGPQGQLEYREALRLIYGLVGHVLIFDFSGRQDEEKWLLMKEMDLVLAVVDPMPDKLLLGQGTLERLKLSGLQIQYLINKVNEGVDLREVMRFLKLRQTEQLPFLAPELRYSAQFEGCSPWERQQIKNAVSPVFNRVFGRAAP